MSELNEQQVALISAYIKQHGIAQNDLHDDLLDHVCTSIERQIDEGKSFEAAFEQTIKLFGPGGLKQVQQQTFELLTEMNENMKKVAFSFGLTSTILLLAGTIFKLMHWPGAAVLIVLGAGSLAFVYLPLLLWHKLKESPRDESLMHISGFVGLTLTTIGVLFKIMHWPGASVTLLSGMGILAALYVPLFYFKKYKTSSNKSITLSTGLVAMTCLILVFGLMSVNRSTNFNRGLLLVGAELEDSVEKAENNETLYSKLEGNQAAASLKTAVNQSSEKLQALRLKLISETEGISVEEAKEAKVYLLHGQDNFDIPTYILFGGEEEFSAKALVASLESFQEQLLQVYQPEIRSEMEEILPFDFSETYTFKDEKMDWANYHLRHIPLSGVLSQLSKMQLDIRNAETQALLYLLSQSAVSETPSGDQGASEAQSL